MAFLFYQMLIPVMIPIFHITTTVTVLVIASIFNIVLLIKIPILKIKICLYYRILGQVLFIIFNLMFLVFFLIEYYLPELDAYILLILGYITIGAICGVILLEFIEMIT